MSVHYRLNPVANDNRLLEIDRRFDLHDYHRHIIAICPIFAREAIDRRYNAIEGSLRT